MKNLFLSVSYATLMASSVFAMGAPQGEGGKQNPYSGIIMLVGFFAIMYFLMIRPQQKKAKEKQAMINAAVEGDKIVTSGGIYGTIKKVKESTVRVQIDDQTCIELSKSAIAGVTEKASEAK